MNTDHTTTYSLIDSTWKDDLSEGMTLGEPAHYGDVLTRVVGDLLPLPIVRSSGTADYELAWSRVCTVMETLGVTKIRYANVTDSVKNSLHVRVEDAHGRLPWAIVIENGCFVSEKDGKVIAKVHELDLC